MTVTGKRKLSEVEGGTNHKETKSIPTAVVIPPKKKNKKKKKKKKADSSANIENAENAHQMCIVPEASEDKDKDVTMLDGTTKNIPESGIVSDARTSPKAKKNDNEKPLNSTNGKRKLSDLEDPSKAEAEVKDTGVPPKKKKKRNKKKSTKAEKDGNNLKVCESNGSLSETNGSIQEISNEVKVDIKAGEGNADSSHENKRKKKKKKKKKKNNTKAPQLANVSSGEKNEVMNGPPFSILQDTLSEKTMKAINDMGFTKMTSIQEKAIPPLLEGKDVRGTAKTGSGKTLAFIIPVIEHLCRLNFTAAEGTGALIISPTRELSMQTYDVLKKMIKHHSLTSGILIGGVDHAKEAELLAKGVNVVVATPGRLLNHLKDTTSFVTKNLACLVLDEADRMLDVGFEKEVNAILEFLPKKKQTMFFSATRDKKVNLLARLSLNEEPVEVDVEPRAKTATVDSLEQVYLIYRQEKKFLTLHHFLEKNQKKKIMVFFSTCNDVKFYSKLFNHLKMDVMDINGKNKQEVRTKMFYDFSKLDSGILLCTDVAARGWDIPQVDWIVQYDPPRNPKSYIHRVGRTARAGGKGKALLFIREEEMGILRLLKKEKVHIKLMENLTWDKSKDLQLLVEKIVKNNRELKKLALCALTSHLGGYLKHKSEFIDISTVNIGKLAKCFGYEKPPQLPKVVQNQLDDIFGKPEANPPKNLQQKGRSFKTYNESQYHKTKPYSRMNKPQPKRANTYKGVRKFQSQPKTGTVYKGVRKLGKKGNTQTKKLVITKEL